MVNGSDISPEKAIKMRAWLARHESDKQGEGFYPDQDGFPSAGRVAWALWGGDPAVTWSNKIVSQMEAADENEKKSIAKPEDQHKKLINKVWNNFIEKQHTPTEKKLEKACNKYLDQARARYVQRFKEQVRQKNYNPKQKGFILDLVSFLNIALEQAQIVNVIGNVWKLQYIDSAIKELDLIFKIAKKDPFEFIGSWNNYTQILEESTAQYIKDMSNEIAQTTAKEMQRLVSYGLNEGLPIDDIADLINNDARFNTNRGKLIARTEATRLHASAATKTIKDSNSFGILVKKGWIGNLDGVTRDSHRYLITKYSQKQNAIYPDEYFITEAGKKALYPGDFGLPGEDCNCRCAVKPIVIDT